MNKKQNKFKENKKFTDKKKADFINEFGMINKFQKTNQKPIKSRSKNEFRQKFPSEFQKNSTDFNLEKLQKVVADKIFNRDRESYSYQLFNAEFAKIAQKIGEEGVEVALAAMIFERSQSPKTRQDLIGEICDLFYHNLILMIKSKISLTEIYKELERRNHSKSITKKESNYERKNSTKPYRFSNQKNK